MCGIAGIVRWDGQPASAGSVEAMCDVMRHRGPDDAGLWTQGPAALGMRRLSIIDLETGQQPVSNEDGTVWVVLNGEIYNYQELRRELIRRGHQFRTTGDTETIVHLYEDYGPDLVDRLRGMFAIAVWDVRARQLLLARDRLGIKPLFYACLQGGLAFASELKCLLQLPEVVPRLSWPAVGHLFAFLATPASQSIVDGVQKLEPAHRAILRGDGRLRTERYWDVEFVADEAASEAELVGRLREALRESVELHMRSDVPVGAFLSGGIDSSAVVATMQRLAPHPIKTFSIGFAERTHDETAHARRVAASFGTDHHELRLEPQGLEIVERLAWYLDEPFGDSSAIPTFMVSKLAAEHVKVVLTGDGGDEIFGGYDKYVVERREQQFDRIPRPLRRVLAVIGEALPEGTTGRNFLRHLGYEGGRRYLDASTMFGMPEQERLFRPGVFEQIQSHDPAAAAMALLRARPGAWLSALQYYDLRGYLPLDILTKVDRMTMAHSIEARPPLLDHRLVEFAATVPAAFALHGRTTKYLFKQAMRGLLPDAIIDRPKQGFALPLARWFRGDWGGYVRDVLLSDTCRQRGILEPRYLEQLLRLHAGGRDLDQQLWTLVSFEQWCRTFLDSAPRPAAARVVPIRPGLAASCA
jgi:asparagine synthase (glutamine-hydrolysing)